MFSVFMYIYCHMVLKKIDDDDDDDDDDKALFIRGRSELST